MCDLVNHGAVLFYNTKTTPGLETVSAPNHTVLLMRMEDHILFINPQIEYTTMEFVNQKNLKFQSLKNDRFKNRSPERGFEKAALVRQQIFGGLDVGVQEPPVQIISKIKYTNIPIDSDPEFFYCYVKNVIEKTNPITALDVMTFTIGKQSSESYGKPMYCHNIIKELLGLQMGIVLTSKDLERKLQYLSGKTNFITHVLSKRCLLESEKDVE